MSHFGDQLFPPFLVHKEEREFEAVALTRLCILERNFYTERHCEAVVGFGHPWRGLLALGFSALTKGSRVKA